MFVFVVLNILLLLYMFIELEAILFGCLLLIYDNLNFLIVVDSSLLLMGVLL